MRRRGPARTMRRRSGHQQFEDMMHILDRPVAAVLAALASSSVFIAVDFLFRHVAQ
jgi:hypothetical protein